MASYHHFVSKSFIKHWQPSLDSNLANKHSSNGGVTIFSSEDESIKYEPNLTKVFSEIELNHVNTENNLSKYIEKYFGNFERFYVKGGPSLVELKWEERRAIILLATIQPSRIPCEGGPLVNEILSMNEKDLDQLAAIQDNRFHFMGIDLGENIQMFLNDTGFFVFPLFDFKDLKKVLSAQKTSDLWGIAVPIRPSFCLTMISKQFFDESWLKSNMHIFQTCSVGLINKKMIVPPRLASGGKMISEKETNVMSVCEMVKELRSTTQSYDNLVKAGFELESLNKKVASTYLE